MDTVQASTHWLRTLYQPPQPNTLADHSRLVSNPDYYICQGQESAAQRRLNRHKVFPSSTMSNIAHPPPQEGEGGRHPINLLPPDQPHGVAQKEGVNHSHRVKEGPGGRNYHDQPSDTPGRRHHWVSERVIHFITTAGLNTTPAYNNAAVLSIQRHGFAVQAISPTTGLKTVSNTWCFKVLSNHKPILQYLML